MGTLRFSSLNATKGLEQSRRDDLESLAYMFAYLLQGGKLPWMGVVGADDSVDKRYKKIAQIKENTSFE